MRTISNFNNESNYWGPITKETKTMQKLLLYYLWKGIVSSNCFYLGNQRSIAQKLDCHYNSICKSIKKLETRNLIHKNSEKNGKHYCLNLDSNEITNFLTVISNTLLEKIETKLFGKIVPTEENNKLISIQNKIPDSEYIIIEKHANYLLRNAKKIAQKLAEGIVSEITRAQNNTIVVVDQQEYDVLVAEQFEELQQIFPEITDTWIYTKFGRQRKILKAKLTKL